MTVELTSLLAAGGAVLLIAGLTFLARYLKKKNLADEELFSVICDLTDIVSNIALTDKNTKKIAQALIEVIKFVRGASAGQPEDVQKEQALVMLIGLVDSFNIVGLSDDSLKKLVSMSFTLIK
jgi:hypothetical protein